MLHTRQFQALRSAVPPQQGAQHRCIPHAVSDSKRGKHVATCQVDFSGQLWDLQRSWLSAAVMGAMSLSMLLQPAPAASEEMSIAFPASADREIRQAQQTMVESWAYVQALYFDPSLSHTDWAQELRDSLAASFKASSAAEVAGVTNQLLAKLGDPYTRLLQGDDATALEAQEEGKIVATGLGLQQVLLVPQDSPAAATAAAAAAPALATAPADAAALELSSSSSSSGAAPDAAAAAAAAGQEAMLVSFVVDDSAAAAAGVTQGDLLLAVDGQPVAGQELRQVYKLLSKEADVTMLRQQPGSSSSTASGSIQLMTQLTGSTATTSAPSRGSSSEAVLAAAVAVGYSPDAYTVHLKPTPLEFAPVQFGAIDVDKAVARAAAEIQDSADAVSASSTSNSSGVAAGSSTSSSSSSGNGAGLPDVGYLKLLSFSATAPQEVAQALVDMQYEAAEEHGGHGLAGIIVDLRDNPGGIVEAGISIAQDFLQEGQVLCIALDRSGQEERWCCRQHTR
ncbi:hypothetical protein COO60DRAFT_600078 [Scenedesmus sp. NREL 46B-D3]|nr:hypothetical protein COO60DRAFT_600078 [Scenedesmus sp. NREL 46B-D3]